MKNFVQPGEVLNYANAGADILSGDVVVAGSLIGIAATNIVSGDTGSVNLCGVFELAKITTAAFTQGQKIYWDATAKKLTNVNAGNTLIGSIFVAALQAATTAQVKLIGTNNTADLGAITPLVDNSGGAAADGTIGAVSDSATAANAIKELATKLNEVIAAL